MSIARFFRPDLSRFGLERLFHFIPACLSLPECGSVWGALFVSIIGPIFLLHDHSGVGSCQSLRSARADAPRSIIVNILLITHDASEWVCLGLVSGRCFIQLSRRLGGTSVVSTANRIPSLKGSVPSSVHVRFCVYTASIWPRRPRASSAFHLLTPAAVFA